MQYIVHAYISL